ncbi:hypothetical protein JK386_12825 [Nocardioides sp. zg-536]|uniref:Uncharacterized protein n=1 Tax=Nocardioides faecalis TaxID=2803858 RepID=A0A938Y248_9ACTN|nr:hypothetical protein [Nocardioides faecalis]MBM9460787.1 hypothetical protein [Nocardioides faecalis]QVI57979.1 hypothetical protein KG111_13200 [Nocardioides faecalis]
MTLHGALADLARDHGEALFRDANAFRGSLDDYLDEGQASSGTINLLTDAVRLGALDSMLAMLDSGANAADAVDSAGQRLARDRGSADVRGCQWAVAVLGFALGRVPESLVTGLDPEAGTTAPPQHGPAGTSPTAAPTTSPTSPPQPPIVSPGTPPPGPGPSSGQPGYGQPGYGQPGYASYPGPSAQSGQHGGSQGEYGAPTASYGTGGWSQQPPAKKSNTALIAIAAVIGVLIVALVAVGIVLATGGDDDKKAGGDPTTSQGTDGTDTPTTPDASETSEVPDIGGPTIEGLGYTVQVPKGWTDGTEPFRADNPGLTTLDRVLLWGTTFNTSRANVIVETQSSYGSTDPEDLKDAWKRALVASDPTATIRDIPDASIGGQPAKGVEIERTNDAGVAVSQRSFLVISGDKGYSITVSLKKGDDKVFDEFDKILSTWRWDEES